MFWTGVRGVAVDCGESARKEDSTWLWISGLSVEHLGNNFIIVSFTKTAINKSKLFKWQLY